MNVGRLIILLILASAIVFAQSGAQVDVISTGTLGNPSAGNATAQGGNVSMVNLTSTQSTTRWQGFFGNVSGTLSLGLGADIFYDFSVTAITAVYACQNQSVDFTSMEAGAAADIDTVWGYATGADRAQNFYTGTTSIGGISAPSVELEPIGGGFNSTILDIGVATDKNNFIFGVNVQEPAVACFNGADCEYQLMVPSDGQEVYYFFLEI